MEVLGWDTEEGYVFIRDKDTKQVHIYGAILKLDGTIKPHAISECGVRESRNGRYDRKEYDAQRNLKIYDEDSARCHCPEYGRPLCGRCVSTLYADCIE